MLVELVLKSPLADILQCQTQMVSAASVGVVPSVSTPRVATKPSTSVDVDYLLVSRGVVSFTLPPCPYFGSRPSFFFFYRSPFVLRYFQGFNFI